MKSSIASALSVSGVLAAGAIALAANTNVLDGGVSTAKGAPAMAAQVVVPVGESSTTTAAAAVNPTPSSPVPGPTGNLSPKESSGGSPDTTVPRDTPDTTVPGDSQETSYSIPGIGTVNVAVVDGVLSITRVDVIGDWSHETRNSSRGNGFEVIFTKTADSTTYEFNVALIGGRVVTSIRDITEQPDYPTYEDDEDEYEEHEDEDHDEDHDEDDDHEEYEDD